MNPKVYNLTRSERAANKQLFDNKEIIIKRADKGSAVVIQNTTDYIKEAEKQLSDTKFYLAQNQDLTETHSQQVNQILTEMLQTDEIDKSCFEYLSNSNPRTPRFYTLPKIHKNTLPPPGRPILSANQSPTERISEFVDFFLKPTIPHL